MSERELSDKQKARIEELKRAWMEEFDEIDRSMPKPEKPTLDGPRTWAFARLGEKYQKLIQEVVDEDK